MWVLTTAVAAAGLVLGTPLDAGAEEPLRSSMHDVVIGESDDTRVMTFRLELSAPHDAPLSWQVGIGYDEGDDGWAGPDDVSVPDPLVTIPAGETKATIDVVVAGDDVVEATEIFRLTADSLDDDTLDLDTEGTGAIVDDDVVRFDVRNAIASESDGQLVFQLTLSERTRRDVVIGYRTVAVTADGTDAQLGEHEITIPWGSVTGFIRVPVRDDDTIESDETFTLEVLHSDAEIGDGTAIGMIVNDDHVVPDVTVADAAAVESDDAMTFTVSLSEPTTGTVTVAYTTGDGTGSTGAQHRTDYRVTAGSLTFEAGTTELSVDVPLVGDAVPELEERFRFVLTGSTGGTITDQRANGTIEDDDPIRLGSIL